MSFLLSARWRFRLGRFGSRCDELKQFTATPELRSDYAKLFLVLGFLYRF